MKAQVSRHELERYLESQGWIRRFHPNDRIHYFETPSDDLGKFSSVVIPASSHYSDANERIAAAINNIAIAENRSIGSVIWQTRTWDKDLFQARIIERSESLHSLPLNEATEAIDGLRQLVSYTAYTEENPKPFFDKVGSIGREFTDKCYFGHTFEGSFGFTIECPLSIKGDRVFDGFEEDVPLERNIFERLAVGLSDLKQAVSTDDITPIVNNYQSGLNANLCNTLHQVYESVKGRKIEYNFVWSAEVKTEVSMNWRPVVFEGKAYEIVGEAARYLEKVEEQHDCLIIGRVVQMRSETPNQDEQDEFEHVITMFWEREKGRAVKIRVPLSSEQYVQACDAHIEGSRVRIYGVPEKSGKIWTLTLPHDFSIVN